MLYWNILWSLFSMHVSCQDFSYLCSKEVCVPNVETYSQMYAELNKTSPCFRFWEAERPGSVLNSCLQAVTDAVGYSWLPFWMFSMACSDSLSKIPNTACRRCRSVGQKHVWKNSSQHVWKNWIWLLVVFLDLPSRCYWCICCRCGKMGQMSTLDMAATAAKLKAVQTSLWWHFCLFKVDISVV